MLQFDGGCSKKHGAGGYLVWDRDQKCLGGAFKYYGSARPTNNKAEAQALVDAMLFATNSNSIDKTRGMLV